MPCEQSCAGAARTMVGVTEVALHLVEEMVPDRRGAAADAAAVVIAGNAKLLTQQRLVQNHLGILEPLAQIVLYHFEHGRHPADRVPAPILRPDVTGRKIDRRVLVIANEILSAT